MMPSQPRLRRLMSGIFALAMIGLPAVAHSAAPSLYNVRDVVLQDANFLYPDASTSCALTQAVITNALNNFLVERKVPLTLAAAAKPTQFGMARVELVPEIATMNPEGLDCTSWVSLTAQTEENIKIMPVDILRGVTVVYWRQGILVNSGQSTHAAVVAEALQKVAARFVQDYAKAQPQQ